MKYIYLNLRLLIFRSKNSFETIYNYHDIDLGSSHNCSIGYYDINSFSYDETKIIFTRNKREERIISVFDIYSRSIDTVGTTKAYSSQQNCMVQFIPKSNNRIIYNFSSDDNYKACIQNIKSQQKEILPISYYDISYDSKIIIGLNFNNLNKYALGYGYKGKYEDDKVYLKIYNREKKDLKHFGIVSILDNLNIPATRPEDYYINHLKFVPDSHDFIFLLRKRLTNKKFTSRLIKFYSKNEKFETLIDEGHISHFVWFKKKKLIFFGSVGEKQNQYHLFNTELKAYEFIKLPDISMDGHPVISHDKNFMYYDTYPDKNRKQSLYKFNFRDNSERLIDSLYSPTKYFDEYRCDLHPRISPKGNFLCIDHTARNKRCIRIYHITD